MKVATEVQKIIRQTSRVHTHRFWQQMKRRAGLDGVQEVTTIIGRSQSQYSLEM